MIHREFTDPHHSLHVTVKCFPPSTTVYVHLRFAWCTDKPPLIAESTSVDSLRAWLWSREANEAEGLKGLKAKLGGGAFQDFRVDLSRVLNEVEGEFAKITGQ